MIVTLMQGKPIVPSFCLIAALLLGTSAARAAEQRPDAAATEGRMTFEDVIPLTRGNLRGHTMLYNEGWLVVSSSRKALDFAKEHSLARSRDVLAEAAASAAGRGKDLRPTSRRK